MRSRIWLGRRLLCLTSLRWRPAVKDEYWALAKSVVEDGATAQELHQLRQTLRGEPATPFSGLSAEEKLRLRLFRSIVLRLTKARLRTFRGNRNG